MKAALTLVATLATFVALGILHNAGKSKRGVDDVDAYAFCWLLAIVVGSIYVAAIL